MELLLDVIQIIFDLVFSGASETKICIIFLEKRKLNKEINAAVLSLR